MKRTIVLFCLLGLSGIAHSQKTDSFLVSLLKGAHKPALDKVMSDPATYRVQIIYTRIDRDKHNKPSFTNYYFNFDPQLYFNPASTVKLPLAFLSLEKLNDLHIKGVN